MATYSFQARQTQHSPTTVFNCKPDCVGTTKSNYEYTKQTITAYRELHNVYVTARGAPFYEEAIDSADLICQYSYAWEGSDIQGKADTIPLLVGGQSSLHGNYGHFFIDFFVFLIVLPNSLLQRAHFVFVNNTTFAPNVLGLLGIENSSITFVNFKDYFIAKKFIQIYPFNCLSPTYYVIKSLYKRLKKVLKLEVKQPRRFVLRNRRTTRYITNDLDLIEDFQEVSGDEGIWELQMEHSCIRSAFRYYYEAKIFFIIHGSGFVHGFMMQSGTVSCDYVLLRYPDWKSICIARDIHYIWAFDEINKNEMKAILVNENLARNMVKKAMELIRHSRRNRV